MILLIQFRTDQSGPHEIQCVYTAGSVAFDDFSILNARSESVDSTQLLQTAKSATAVILGGLGEGGYETPEKTKIEGIKDKLASTIEYLLVSDTPTLGLCFGHQIIADLAGGTVTTPQTETETGIAEIHLTPAGQDDPLFSDLPSPFHAVIGHKASVTTKPEQASHLAESERSPLQSLRYGENVYTCQFHPELDADDLFARLQLYPEYLESEIEYDRDTQLEAKKITESFFSIYT